MEFYEQDRWPQKKLAHAFAYEIYTAATLNKSQQPTKNIHFYPQPPHKVHIGKKYKVKSILERKKRGKLQNHYQIPTLSYHHHHAKRSFPLGFIIDGSQMYFISAIL